MSHLLAIFGRFCSIFIDFQQFRGFINVGRCITVPPYPPTRIFYKFSEFLSFENDPTVSTHTYIFQIFGIFGFRKRPHRIHPLVYFSNFRNFQVLKTTPPYPPTRIFFKFSFSINLRLTPPYPPTRILFKFSEFFSFQAHPPFSPTRIIRSDTVR